MWRLDPGCELSVMSGASDAPEELGDGLQGPASRALRMALDPLRERIRSLGEARALEQAEALAGWIESQPDYSALCTDRRVKGRRLLRDEIAYPAHEKLVPRVLRVRHARNGRFAALDHVFAPSDFRELHDLLCELQQGTSKRPTSKAHRALIEDLVAADLLKPQPDDVAPPEAREEGIWFLGHNSVFLASEQVRVVVDPWFRPWREGDPEDYRPLRPVDVGALDAVLVTHSHGDHFHLGSLLAFPRDTRIFVPKVKRASVLCADLAALLTSLGFTRVTALDWWETARVGDVDLQAMPFFGEQACAIDLVDPDLRNQGNTWCVRTPRFSAAFLADTGRDPAGAMTQVALEARRRWGSVDAVFGGMRGFELAPLMLPFTTLDAMFPNVPLELLAVKQKLMNDPSDLLAVAEIFGAAHVVPYADGGAPWYWREGMGPTYAGYPSYPEERAASGVDEDDLRSAPFPERLEEAAEARRGEAAFAEPLVLRPGDLVRFSEEGLSVGSVEGFAWPWD